MPERSSRRPSARVSTAALLFAALVWFGLKPVYARFLFGDVERWGRQVAALPESNAPGYSALLREAAARIPIGARVAIVYSTLDWNRGYSYGFFQAQYDLAGRVIVPLSWVDGEKPWRIREAAYAVVYRAEPPDGDWVILFENRDGAVARRGR